MPRGHALYRRTIRVQPAGRGGDEIRLPRPATTARRRRRVPSPSFVPAPPPSLTSPWPKAPLRAYRIAQAKLTSSFGSPVPS